MENRAFYPEKMQPPAGPYAHGVEIPENAKITYTAGQIGVDFTATSRTILTPRHGMPGITASPSSNTIGCASVTW